MDDQVTTVQVDKAPPKYDPNHLLDVIIEKLNLKNDAALVKVLNVTLQVISRLRIGKITVEATLLIAMHFRTFLAHIDGNHHYNDLPFRFV